jgi:hypothetical protein
MKPLKTLSPAKRIAFGVLMFICIIAATSIEEDFFGRGNTLARYLASGIGGAVCWHLFRIISGTDAGN